MSAATYVFRERASDETTLETLEIELNAWAFNESITVKSPQKQRTDTALSEQQRAYLRRWCQRWAAALQREIQAIAA